MSRHLVVLALVALAMLAVYFYVDREHRLRQHYDAVDEKIEDMLPDDRGQVPTPMGGAEATLIVRVSRVAGAGAAATRIGVDLETWDLPLGWQGEDKESAERVKAYEATMAEVYDAIQQARKGLVTAGQPVRAAIRSPEDDAERVPPRDVVAVLNLFFKAGIMDITFEGGIRG